MKKKKLLKRLERLEEQVTVELRTMRMRVDWELTQQNRSLEAQQKAFDEYKWANRSTKMYGEE